MYSCKAVDVDGGTDYIRITGNLEDFEELSEVIEDGEKNYIYKVENVKNRIYFFNQEQDIFLNGICCLDNVSAEVREMINLKKANIKNYSELHAMQIKLFQALLNKYNDIATSLVY